jgi:AraC-like DNA-binding protein
MVTEMDVNRTTLSQFVNQTYGVNFSRYINRLRLNEMQELLKMPESAGKRLDELARQVGFHDMKHYHRVRAQERNDSEPTSTPKPQ